MSDFKAAEIAQVYVGLDSKRIECPVRELKAFKKVFLEAGEKQEVEIVLTQEDFKVFNEKADNWEIMSDSCTMEIAASSRDIRLVQKDVAICF